MKTCIVHVSSVSQLTGIMLELIRRKMNKISIKSSQFRLMSRGAYAYLFKEGAYVDWAYSHWMGFNIKA